MTDKNRIMDFLKEYSEFKREYSLKAAREEYLVNTIKKLDEGPTSLAYKDTNDSIVFPVILNSLILGLFGMPFAAIIILVLNLKPAYFIYKTFHWNFANAHPIWTHILFSFVLVSVLAIPLAILICGSHKESDIKQFESYQNALTQRPALVRERDIIIEQKQRIQLHLKQMASRGILHPDYLPYTGKLLWYMEKGRADTLKEAINLLEHDLDEADRREEEREYRKEMRWYARQQQEKLDYISDETDRAASAAQSAAAWSAAGTLLTAAEIERQKKRERE